MAPELAESEKEEIIRLIRADLPLPEKYRLRLFNWPGRPELVWRGKGELPVAQGALELVSGPGMEGADCLISGDNLAALAALLVPEWRNILQRQGGLKLVYIDPPFNTGQEFTDKSAGLAYSDNLDENGYLDMLRQRLGLIRELLAEAGCIYVHCDWRTSGRVRLLLDEIFGHHVNEIIWHYTGGGRSKSRFSRKHDTIHVYSKTGSFTYNGDAVRVPYKKSSGYARSGIRAKSGKRYLPNPLGALPDDVWDLPIINPLSKERLGYPTQKPEALLERIIQASSMPGDWIADFFCGSGVACAVAKRLGRKWIGVDNSPLAIEITAKRLAAIDAKGGKIFRPHGLYQAR